MAKLTRVSKVVKRIVKSFVKLPEVLRQLSKLYLKLAGKEAKLYLRLTPKNLMRLLPHKLIKLPNGLSKIYLKLALIKLNKLRDPGSNPVRIKTYNCL